MLLICLLSVFFSLGTYFNPSKIANEIIVNKHNVDCCATELGSDSFPTILDISVFSDFTSSNQCVLGIVTSSPESSFNWQCRNYIAHDGILSSLPPEFEDDASFANTSPDLFRILTVYYTGYYEITVWPSECGMFPCNSHSFVKSIYMTGIEIEENIPPNLHYVQP